MGCSAGAGYSYDGLVAADPNCIGKWNVRTIQLTISEMIMLRINRR